MTSFPVPAVRALAPRFTADGLYLLSSRGGPDGLWRIRSDRAEEIWRGADGAISEPPAVSPRGDWIAVTVRNGTQRQLTLVSADGGLHQTVGEGLTVAGTPAWSPDGSALVIGGSLQQRPGLFRVPIDGGAVSRLIDGEAYDPVWSPTDRLIVYTSETGAGTSLRAVDPDGQPQKLPAQSQLGTEGARARRRQASTRFTPDGRGLVFMQGPPGSQEFWFMDVNTHATRLLARLSNPATISTFDVTPDGSRIVFDRVDESSNLVLIERPAPSQPPR